MQLLNRLFILLQIGVVFVGILEAGEQRKVHFQLFYAAI